MKKILKFLKPHKAMVALVFMLVICTSIGNLYLPDLMSKILGKGISYDAFPHILPDGTAVIQIIQVVNIKLILSYGGIMIAITLVISLLSICVSYLSSHIAMNFSKDLRQKVFQKVMSFSSKEEDKFGTSSLITRTSQDITQVQMLVMMSLRMMINVPIMFIGGIVMALAKSPKMTLVLLGSIPIVVAFILLIGKSVLPMYKVMQGKIDRLTMVSRESITGVRVIRAFGGEEKESRRFENANRDVTKLGIKSARVMSTLMPFMTIVMNATVLAIVFIAAVNIKNSVTQTYELDSQALPNMMAVIQYIMQIMMSVVMFAMIFIMVPRANVSAVRIMEILETEETIKNDEDAQIINPNSVKTLSFNKVYFGYDEAEKRVLENISFECHSGTTTAIIGSTGSGKSTISNLIPRLYDVTEGNISINGIDIRKIEMQNLHQIVGLVFQKAVLVSGTISDNIMYSADKANKELLTFASKISQSSNFIMEKELGFDSTVEHGGGNFSGGQKQRLSIARAIASQSKILIFDDSFSALDFKTDSALRQAISENLKDNIIIVIAQRIGSIIGADNIIVLDEGKIIAQGKHEYLLKNCEIYRNIALSQLSESELNERGGN